MLAARVATFAGILVVVLLPLLALRRLPLGERRVVTVTLVLALALRVAVALVLDATEAWHITERGATTPDEASMDRAARLLAAGDSRSPVVLAGSLHTAWLLVSAAIYSVWDSLLAIKLLNAVLGTVLVIPVYLLARGVSCTRAARYAAWAVALFPNAIVWSALGLREPLIALLITAILLAAIHPPEGWSRAAVAWVALVVISVTVLAFTRSYMAPAMLLLLIGAAVVHAATRWTVAPLVAALAAGALALAATVALPTGPVVVAATVSLLTEPPASVYNPLTDCDEGLPACERTVVAAEGGTPRGAASGSADPAEGRNDRTEGGGAEPRDREPRLTDSLQSIAQKGAPRAFAIAVLAGRPVWRTTEFFFLLQPGVVLWWTSLPVLVAGSVLLVTRRRYTAATALLGVVGIVVLFLAFTGQFIRHHYMIEPAGLALTAVGAAELTTTARRWRWLAFGAATAMAVAAVVSVLHSLS